MARRLLGQSKSYPGLREIFEAFYAHIMGDAAAPVSPDSLLETVRVQEHVYRALGMIVEDPKDDTGIESLGSDLVLVTGGTGFLGRAVVTELRRRGRQVRVLARRLPASWHRVAGVDYVTGDLAEACDPIWLEGVSVVVHCAAATSGGWAEHQAASIDATEHLVDAMTESTCRRLLHVSSIAVVDDIDEIDESSPYLADPRGSGPYAWGKLESERLVRSRAADAGIEVTVIRPGAIVDYDDFDPPGRLGKRLGNLFVAVGGRKEEMAIVGLDVCASSIARLADGTKDPEIVHLLDPQLPSRHHLVACLRRRNPDLTVLWVPRWAVRPAGALASLMQRLLRPGKTPIDVTSIFGNRKYSTSRSLPHMSSR
jgi:nucleoside-diphosphate-sugar epimerase